MIFYIEQIYEEGLDFDVLEPKERFDLDYTDIVLTDDVKAQGKLEKSGETILCHGSLQTKLSANCTRCLQVFSFAVNAKLSINFVPRVESNKPVDEIELSGMDVEQEFFGRKTQKNSTNTNWILFLQIFLKRWWKKKN